MSVVRGCWAALLLLVSLAVDAQPTPLRILVGFPPGGESDLLARVLADGLRRTHGAPVIVDNRPGANGAVAAEALKHAAPDGTTLMVAPIAVTVFAPLVNERLRYDPVKDFAPVSLLAHFQMALAAGPGAPARSLPEYLDWVRGAPARGAIGVPLAGGPTHFFAVMLARSAGVELDVVAYKGSANFVTDLLGGHVPAGITVLSQLLEHHRAGRVRLLATSGAQRSLLAPDVPTFRELGFAAIEGTGWQAVHTVAGTPAPIVERLARDIAAVMAAPEVRARLEAAGLEPAGSTPAELEARIARDTALWRPIVKASGFRAEP